MSSFLETLAAYETGKIADLSAIIGSRFYPVEAPQGVELPFGIFTQISGEEDIHHKGHSGWGTMRVQYDFYSTKFHEVHDAARALRAAFEGRSLYIATCTQICFCRVETEYDDYESDEQIYRRSLDLLYEYNITNQ